MAPYTHCRRHECRTGYGRRRELRVACQRGGGKAGRWCGVPARRRLDRAVLAPDGEAAMTVGRATAATPIRVLLVEDNPGDARLILEMLRETQDLDFELESLESLAPALARISRTGVDVVLLDLGLPDSQGLETFSRVQAHLPNDPIVVISGLDDQSVALDAVRAGAQDYLVKGRIEGQLLARVIRYAIERKRAEARLGAIVRFALDAHITMDPLGNVTG